VKVGQRSVTFGITIDRPPEVVFDFISDPANDPRWCPSVSDSQVVATDDGLVSYRFVQHVGPFRHEEASDIVEADRPRRLRWRFTAMGSVVDATVELLPVGSGTRVVQTNEVSQVGRLQWLVQERIARRELPRQQARLKALLEGA
jgi:uncharacterized protein YndB with AHSA1/START domain